MCEFFSSRRTDEPLRDRIALNSYPKYAIDRCKRVRRKRLRWITVNNRRYWFCTAHEHHQDRTGDCRCGRRRNADSTIVFNIITIASPLSLLAFLPNPSGDFWQVSSSSAPNEHTKNSLFVRAPQKRPELKWTKKKIALRLQRVISTSNGFGKLLG